MNAGKGKDTLSREQLKEQERKRTELLEKMRAEGAPTDAIAEAEKKLKLTQLRLRRLTLAEVENE